jgi:hypothetical protein
MIRSARLPAVCFLGLMVLAPGSPGQPPPPRPAAHLDGALDPDRVRWSALRYEAHKLFLTGRSEVRFADQPTRRLAPELIPTPESAPLGSGAPRTGLLELESRFIGRHSLYRIWFDPETAASLQRRRVRTEKSSYEKTYRYTRDGVFSRRLSPADREERSDPEAPWSDLDETFYPHPKAAGECRAVTEPSLIFYLLATADLSRPLTICTFSNKVVHRVLLRPDGVERLAVDYLERSEAGAVRRNGDVETRKVVVEARPLDPEEGQGDFEFLGLEGDVMLYLDPRLGAPVRVTGRLPGLGRIDVELVEAELR